MTRDDDELGPVRRCPRCAEDWPDDDEFFRPGSRYCHACRSERRIESMTDDRREMYRQASRRYRARRRESFA